MRQHVLSDLLVIKLLVMTLYIACIAGKYTYISSNVQLGRSLEPTHLYLRPGLFVKRGISRALLFAK